MLENKNVKIGLFATTAVVLAAVLVLLVVKNTKTVTVGTTSASAAEAKPSPTPAKKAVKGKATVGKVVAAPAGEVKGKAVVASPSPVKK